MPARDPDVLAHLEANRAVVRWLRSMAEHGAEIASACTGAFLLGEAGLLEVGERRELRGDRLAREPQAGTASQRRQGSAPRRLLAGYSCWAAVGVAA